jgi:hypothetical protein
MYGLDWIGLDWIGLDWELIRFFGDGGWRFRSYSDSLFQTPECRPSKK